MPITIEEVRKIAKLARVELTLVEEKRHAETISAVLDYMKILDEVDIDNTKPTYQVADLKNVVREDFVVECKNKEELMKCMPSVENDKLIVPIVFE